jgi:hypothetical protein
MNSEKLMVQRFPFSSVVNAIGIEATGGGVAHVE